MKTELALELDNQTALAFSQMTKAFKNLSCLRCNGLMVQEDCLDLLSSQIGLSALRCIQCGDLVDSVILRNRTHPPALGSKRQGKWSSIKHATTGYR